MVSAEHPKIMTVPFKAIRFDPRTQMRVKMSEEAIEEYREFWEKGSEPDHVTLFFDAKERCYWIGDGFHSIRAGERAGYDKITRARVYEGDIEDAMNFALSANSMNALKRTAADKIKAVDTALTCGRYQALTVMELADLCMVSRSLIYSRKRALGVVVGDSEPTESVTQPQPDADGDPDKITDAVPVHGVSAEHAQSADKPLLTRNKGRMVMATFDSDPVVSATQQIARLVKKLEKQPGGEYLVGFSDQARDLGQHIKMSSPGRVCKVCDGDGETSNKHKCEMCSGRGWVARKDIAEMDVFIQRRNGSA